MTAVFWGRGGDGFQASLRAQRGPELADGGIDLDERWLGLPELEHALFETPACRDGDVDLILVPADWLPRLASSGAIRPLDEAMDAAPIDDWPAAWSPAFVDVVSFGVREGAASTWGVPFHDGPPLLIWRTDLFESPSERLAYRKATGRDLVPAETWADFDAQVAWFTRPADDLWGTVLAGAPDGHNNVYDFVTQLRVRGADVLDDDGRPDFGGDAGRSALLWMRDRVTSGHVPPWSHELDSVQSGAAFAAGSVAIMVNWAGYVQLAESPGSRVRGRVGAGIAPARADGTATPVVNAFWALAVTSGARHADEAWAAVRRIATAEGDVRTTLAGSSGTRLDTWADPRVASASPAFFLFEEAHRASRPLPMVPELPGLVQVINSLVDRVVWLGEDVDRELAHAVGDARDLLSGESPDG
ncbi:multiple sugar transport system substrate-binding protein [Labedella gwakjiensis]|uniref:Extracellular solute-binding protein n=1 Tax=Labedella gwakjiensis TaxID=390269 RepID=A0A2P8GU92_9MICO|nr:extracellular solute-binding protein [Labedella gwakjiensis]PSL37523.1 multiple sugar transport system substrate-binding protein [Labedella gwakjiensis]RUQ84824.1 extracellular solute-binding protein [Labedella gwakjiensis]